MAQAIIFGVKDFASLAHFYLKHDSPHEVAGFSVHENYMPADRKFEGLPVEAFETVEEKFPPERFRFFAPMSHRNMNRNREEVYLEIKRKGYRLISYVSSRATVYPGTQIGENAFILEDNTIQPFTPVGNNVVMWSDNHIGHHGLIHDHVFFTSHVVLSGHCTVGSHSFFGVNATIRDGLTIAEGSLIAMGACVVKNTQPWGVYKGNPAQLGKTLSCDLDF